MNILLLKNPNYVQINKYYIKFRNLLYMDINNAKESYRRNKFDNLLHWYKVTVGYYQWFNWRKSENGGGIIEMSGARGVISNNFEIAR